MKLRMIHQNKGEMAQEEF